MRSLAFATGMSLLMAVAGAQEKPEPPPEIKKTTETFAGKWTYDATVTLPGAGPVKFKMTCECKPIALGNGVDCTMEGKAPAPVGVFSQTCLVGYSPEDKKVHLLCISSAGEIHDHKGSWKEDNRLEFEPLEFTMDGRPATETLTFTFPDAKTSTFRSTVKTASDEVVFEATGKKR